MATDYIDTSLPLTVKKEEDNCNDNDSGSDISTDDINILSMPLPLLSVDNSSIHHETNSEFLHLSEMVCLYFYFSVLYFISLMCIFVFCIFFIIYTVLFLFYCFLIQKSTYIKLNCDTNVKQKFTRGNLLNIYITYFKF